MMSIEALLMVLLAACAVVLAFTKCKCPTPTEEHRIAWLPTSLDAIRAEEETNKAGLRS